MDKVQIEIVNAHELDPSKKYLIELDKFSYTEEDAYKLSRALGKLGIKGITTVKHGPKHLEVKVIEGS